MSKEQPYEIHVTHVDGGIDLTVHATDGMKIDLIDAIVEQGSEVTLHLRDYDVPREGSRVMTDGRLVKVAGRRYDGAGKLWLLDEDTRVWVIA